MLDEKLSPDEIKKSIQNWQADDMRVYGHFILVREDTNLGVVNWQTDGIR